MRRGGCFWVVLVGIVVVIAAAALQSQGNTTHTAPTTAPRITPTTATLLASQPTSSAVIATATQSAAPTAAPSATSTSAPTSIPAPQVVTAKENPVNVRQSAALDAPVVASLAAGTDAPVLSEDTTGPDGATRWVHVRAGDKDGYVRSDLVSSPHTASADAQNATTPTSPGFTPQPTRAAATLPPVSNAQRVEATALPTPTTSPALKARLDDLYDWMFNVGCNLDGQNGIGYPLPTWCPFLKKVGIVNRGTAGDEAYANTDLRSSSNDVRLARDVCTALINYAKTDDPAVKIVTVLDFTGKVLDTAGINGKGC